MSYRPTLPRDAYIPKESRPQTREGIDAIAYTWETPNGVPCAAFFTGRQNKPIWRYVFRNPEQRQAKIDAAFAGMQHHQENVKERRAQRVAATNDLKVGDILTCSWGYDQTNVDFYEIVATTAKTVTFRELAQQETPSGYMSGNTVPLPGEFKGPEITRRASGTHVSYAGYPGSKIRHLSRWDGNPCHYSHYA